MVEPGDEAASVAASGGEHAFSYSFLSRRWSGRGGSATWRPGEGNGGGGDEKGPSSSSAAAATSAVAAAGGGVGKNAATAASAVPFDNANNNANNNNNVALSGLSPGTDLSDGSF